MGFFLKDIQEDKKTKLLENSYPVAIVRCKNQDCRNNKRCNKDFGTPFSRNFVKFHQDCKRCNHNKLLYLNEDLETSRSFDEPFLTLNYGEEYELIPSANKDKRNIFYIAGASGSGKSYITVKIVKNYQRLYPNRRIFVVSALEEDDTLDNIKNLIRLNEDDMEELDINNPVFYNSFFIFDDWENMSNKKTIERVMTDILIMGRKHKDGQGNISCCILSHIINRGRGLGTLILNEATHYILYPLSTSHHSLNYILSRYIGMTENDVRDLKKIKSRWICIHKNYPNYIISSQTARLLHTE